MNCPAVIFDILCVIGCREKVTVEYTHRGVAKEYTGYIQHMNDYGYLWITKEFRGTTYTQVYLYDVTKVRREK